MKTQKIKHLPAGLSIRGNSWFVRITRNSQRFQNPIGHVDEMTDIQAFQVLAQLKKIVKEQGIPAAKFTLDRTVRQSQGETLAGLFRRFIDEAKLHGTRHTKGQPFRKATIENYESAFRHARFDDIRDMLVTDLTPDVLREWHTKQARRYPEQRRSLEVARRYLRTFLSWAITDNLIDTNPLANSNNWNYRSYFKARTETTHRIQVQNVNEIGKFLRSLISYQAKINQPHFESHRNLIIFILLTGLRKKETTYCTWDKIKWDENFIQFSADDMKSRKSHRVALNTLLVTLLRHQLKNQKLKNIYHPKGLVFHGLKRNTPISSITYHLSKILENAGITDKKPGFHFLRRTNTALFSEVENDPEKVSLMRGHALQGITSIYKEQEVPLEHFKMRMNQILDVLTAKLLDSLDFYDIENGIFRKGIDGVTKFQSSFLEIALFKSIWREGKFIENAYYNNGNFVSIPEELHDAFVRRMKFEIDPATSTEDKDRVYHQLQRPNLNVLMLTAPDNFINVSKLRKQAKSWYEEIPQLNETNIVDEILG
jgi:integrase